MKRTAAILLSAIIAAAYFGASARAAEIKVVKNIVFSNAGGVEIKGDIYIPEGKGPFPGMIYIHGGGFVAGSKDFKPQTQIPTFLAENGFISFSVNYRLLQEGGVFPNCTYDVKCALCWFKKNGAQYGLDPKRVGVLGESAGAYLAAMLGVTAGMPQFAGQCPAAEGCDDSVTAVVAVYPPTDFATLKTKLTQMIKNEMIRYGKIKDKEVMKKYMVEQSPVTYAKNAAPTLLIHGAKDLLVNVEQSREFYDVLKAAGREVEYLELPNAPHSFFSEDYDSGDGATARARALAFLNKWLKSEK